MDNKNEIKAMLEKHAETVGLTDDAFVVEAQKESDRQMSEWKAERHETEIEDEFRTPHELVKVILSTRDYNGLIFFGEGGIGKTVLTLNVVKSHLGGGEWEYSNGYTTPLALYEFLFKNRDKRAIVLDDVEGIFNNPLSLSILKGALWDADGKRIVQYSSKSDKAEFPDKFIMNAKIIILCNQIPKQSDPSTRAMVSRTIPYEVSFSFAQKMQLCEKFIVKDDSLSFEQKQLVLTLLKRDVTQATLDFNFRTLRKLIAFVRYDIVKAEDLFKATTENDEGREAYLDAVKQTSIVKDQVRIFCERTAMSRRTFFTIKKKMSSAIVQSKEDTALAQTPVIKKQEGDKK